MIIVQMPGEIQEVVKKALGKAPSRALRFHELVCTAHMVLP